MDNEIKVTFPGGLRVNAEYKGRIIQTDQPVYQGGEGTAPAPFDLFLASLAACAGFYTVAFCRKRGIPTENASLLMKTERKPENKRIEKISFEIRLPAEFPEKYRNAVINAVDTCSVKVHIQNPPQFETEVKIG